MVAVIAAVGAIGACSNSKTEQATSSPVPSSAQSSTVAATPVAHNQADVMFAHMMIPHHQQAIQMSDVILSKQGIDPRVVELAKQIKAAQGPEIERMQGWLSQWGAPGMTGMPGMNGMPGNPPSGHEGMPGMDGMMSAADMQALQNAQGVAASKLYLTQMITHHQGAIAMAQNEIKNGQFSDGVAMAQSIASSQQKEIDTMNQILSSLGG
jgi:uncharacterized protein (DUF305 family)